MRQLGPYVLLHALGDGGSGRVYRAQDRRQGRLVAVKVVRPGPGGAAQLERELWAGRRLDHPHIGRVDACERLDDGQFLLVMPLYEGKSLDRLLLPLTVELTLDLAAQVASGLAHAHDQGVIHCDLKPANVLLGPGGARILDFGLARVMGEAAPGEPQVVGTLEYRSPEAARGDLLDARSDLWSLGVLIYELLTGVSPFRPPGSPAATLRQIAAHDPPSLRTLRPDLPPGLGEVVARLLHRRPENRYASAQALLADLAPIRAGGTWPHAAPGALRGRRHPGAGPVAFTARLPALPPLVLGREHEAALLGLYLEDPACRLVTVVGLGGVGKSTLALAGAHGQGHSDVYGWAGFVNLTAARPGHLLATIASALGLERPGTATLSEVVRALGPGAGRRLLLLDAAEHLTDEAEVLSTVLAECPNLTLLVTSRARLGLDEEWVLPLGGLAYPPAGLEPTPPPPQEFPACVLFGHHARQHLPDFRVEHHWAEVARICRHLDGHPLGVRLAADTLGRLTPGEIVTHLERDVSLRQVFEESAALLDGRGRALLGRLGALVGEFTPEAAEVVLGAQAAELAALHAHALLDVTVEGRYRQPPALRQFCAGLLAALPDAGAVRRRHTGYYLSRLRSLALDVRGSARSRAVDAIGDEDANFYAAVTQSVAGGEALAGDVAEPLRVFLTQQGRSAEGWALFRAAHGEYAQACAAWFALLTGQLGEADTLSAAVSGHDPQAQLVALNSRAGLHWGRGNLDEARHLSLDALALARTLGDVHTGAACTANLALLEEARGDVQAARRYHAESLDLAERGHNHAQMALSLNNLAALHLGERDSGAARPFLERGLLLAAQHGLHRMRPLLQSNLGLCLYAQGEFSHAQAAYQEAESALRARGDEGDAATVQAYLAQALVAGGEREAGWALLRKSLTSAARLDHPGGILGALVRLAEVVSAHDPALAAELAAVVAHHPQADAGDRALARDLAPPAQAPHVDLAGAVETALRHLGPGPGEAGAVAG